MFTPLMLIGLVAAAPATVDRTKLAPAAESLIGIPYDLGGRHRLKKKRKSQPTREGVDCQAVVF